MDTTTGATNVANVINNTSLHCRTNSISSSNSSGYASGHSSASTPATSISSHYDSSTHTTHTTSVPSSEHVPTATVAPVTPFYSDTTLGQQYRQQYYQSYPYSNTTAQYSPVYDACTGNSYHNLTTPSVERSLTYSNNKSQQRLEKQSKILSSHSTSNVSAASQHYNALTTTTTCATTKPQATATPFFSQPTTNMNSSTATYYDAYGKYKTPNTTKLTGQAAPEYATNYTNHIQHAAAATLSYQQQQQHYYATAKSQLQDVNYAAAVVKPHRQHNVGTSSAYYGSSGTYYDKYIYGPTANTAAYSTAIPSHAHPPHPYSPHEPTTADPYRKAAAAVAANAWHWNMEYAAATAGNCRNIPPAANGGSYLSTPNANSSGPDSFCGASADKYGKYDKYGTYYAAHHHPQQYMTPSTHSTVSGSTANTRNLWPNPPHHTPHLASVQTVMNERLPHTLPPSAPQPQYPHTHAHAYSNTHHPFGTTSNTTTQRQNCCAQPFQQQACYYPRPTQQYQHVPAPNAYGTTQPSHYGTSSNSNTNHKYAAYGNNYKATNNNDLYLTSPFDTPPTAYNYGSASNTAMQQRYGGVTATGAAFYNDLNVQPAFENYAHNTISQPTMMQPHNTSAHPIHHLNYQSYGGNQNNSTAALLEYRKPLSVEADDSYMSSTRVALSNVEQHAANTSSYLAYDVHGNPVAQTHTAITSPTVYSDGGSSSEKSTPTTKNLSLRDFLTTWNEEEEGELNSATEQLSFIVENVENSNYVTASDGDSVVVSSKITPQPHQKQSQQQHQNDADQQFPPYKNTFKPRPKIHVGITVDGPMDVETSQYFNLPDIIIDIEKSNNTSASNPTTAPAESVVADSSLHDHSSCGGHDMFGNFDVEKELDDLQIKRAKLCLEKQLNNEIRILTPEPMESQREEAVDNEKTQTKSNETQSNQTFTAVHHVECEKSYNNAEQFLKDIELNDNNSHSSNSSTFEKEYETFINRIDLDKVSGDREQNMRKDPIIVTHQSTFTNDGSDNISHHSSDIKTPPDPVLLDETNLDETTQNLQDFTMFYKKKRKLMRDIANKEENKPLCKKLKFNEDIAMNESIDKPEISTEPSSHEICSKTVEKACKKPVAKMSLKFKSRRRSSSQFYKLLRRGKVKVNTTILVQRHIANLRERHLPLIKRQSFKNYSTCDNTIYNPRSLMNLTVSLINTNEFQALLFAETEELYAKKSSSQHCEKYSEERDDSPTEHFIKRTKINADIQNSMKLSKFKMVKNSTSLNEMIDKSTLETKNNSKNITESSEEYSSNSNSINGSSSLKEQEDFNGFDDIQSSTTSALNRIESVDNLAYKHESSVCKKQETDNSEIPVIRENVPVQIESNLPDNMRMSVDLIANKVDCSEVMNTNNALDVNFICENQNLFSKHDNERTNEETPENEKFCNDSKAIYETNCKNLEEIELNLEKSRTDKLSGIAKPESNKMSEYTCNNDLVDVSIANSNELRSDFPEIKIIENTENTFPAYDSRNTVFRAHASVQNVEFEEKSCFNEKNKETENLSGLSTTQNQNSDILQKEKEKVEHIPENEAYNMAKTTSFNILSEPPVSAVQTQTFPMMRTKASVKMCDFSNVKNRHSSTKNRSKSVSPTAGNSTKSKLELSNKHKTTASVFDRFKKIDKTKFVQKWAEGIGLTDVADISTMNTTQCIPLPLGYQQIEHSNVEALDLSASSRFLQNAAPICIEEDSNSSSTSTSSSSTSSNSKSDNKSSSSTTSSSSETSTTNSTSCSNTSKYKSNDTSDFNELKALKRELSQHKTRADRGQTETVNIANSTIDSLKFKMFHAKKTDLQVVENVKAEAQDIANLKKILESEHDLETVNVLERPAIVCNFDEEVESVHIAENSMTAQPVTMELCVDDISKNQQPTSLKNITENFIAKRMTKLKDNDNSKMDEEEVKRQVYQNEKQQNHQLQYVVIPKLSDLCKIALNSSFVIKNVNFNENKTKEVEIIMPDKNEPIPPNSPKSPVTVAVTTQFSNSTLTIKSTQQTDECEQRELTVEEAFAEMYRQVGVMSDPEDNVDDTLLSSDNGENQAQDFLLINLAEILESNENENNVFVLQCDMNENLLRVMTTSSITNSVGPNEIDGIAHNNNLATSESTLQLVQILNANDLEIITETNAEENMSQFEMVPTYDQNNDFLDKINEDSYSSFTDLPIIHHEEIVPDNYKKFEKEQFLKYLHAKYVQKTIKKFHHPNRILRKYRRHFLTKKPFNLMESVQHSRK